MREAINRLKREKICVLTGAGISQESGVPTFRGKGGLWEKYDPQIYATMPQSLFTFLHSPQKIAEFALDFYRVLLNSKPNFAHIFIAELERRGLVEGIITQNIDNLHQKAGSKKVCEVHGNAYEFFCVRCRCKEKKKEEDIKEFLERMKNIKNKRFKLINEFIRFMGKCKNCHQRLRPNVVFFGESLPQKEIETALFWLRNTRTLLVIGTSGVVFPVANFPYYAKKAGSFIIEINPEPGFEKIADLVIREKAQKFFERISQEF